MFEDLRKDLLVGRLIILTGPSCAGKTPLRRCLARLYPELDQTLNKVVLYNSRLPRIGEVDGKDYHFRTRKKIEEHLRADNFIGKDVRGDLQALNVKSLSENLHQSDMMYEGNTFIANKLVTHASLDRFNKVSIMLSPLNGEEMKLIHETETIDPGPFITEVMRKKLLRRMRAYKGEISIKDLEEVERRAGSAYEELKLGYHFDHVMPNHDGEDSENWEAFYYPLGDARTTLLAFVALLKGESFSSEHWEKGSFA
ncbi:MAG: hypothetical protein GF401_16345 [Chitinivibrionales bacterium]|nr:hypothetical protein [Chitinivibrionales bacterium]